MYFDLYLWFPLSWCKFPLQAYMLKSVLFVTWFLWIQLAQFSFQFLCGETVYDSCKGACHIVRLFCQHQKGGKPYCIWRPWNQSGLIQNKRIQLATRNWVACFTPAVFQPHHQWFVLLSTLVSMLLYHELLMFFSQSTPFTFPGWCTAEPIRGQSPPPPPPPPPLWAHTKVY